MHRPRTGSAAAGRCALGLGLILSTLCLAPAAKAAVGLAATANTDFRFRGISLTYGKPSLSLVLSYDHDSGVYAGGSLLAAEAPQGGVRFVGYFDYLGYSRRTDHGFAWDVGVSNARLTQQIAVGPNTYDYRYDYTELYAGLVTDRLSAHLYYSPDYLSEGVSTLYAEVDGSIRPADHWRLFGHVGALTPLSGRAPYGDKDERFDFRTGVAAEFKHCEVQLFLTGGTSDPAYPSQFAPGRRAVVLSASYFF